MIGPIEISIIAAITLVTTPQMTNQEIIDAFNNCPEGVSVMQNLKGQIIKVKCDA